MISVYVQFFSTDGQKPKYAILYVLYDQNKLYVYTHQDKPPHTHTGEARTVYCFAILLEKLSEQKHFSFFIFLNFCYDAALFPE